MNGFRGLAAVVAGYILMTVLVMFMTLGLVSFWPGAADGASNLGGPQPSWYLFALPVLGALAIYVGGGWYIGRKAATGGMG